MSPKSHKIRTWFFITATEWLHNVGLFPFSDLPEPISKIPEPAKPVHDHLRPHGDLDDREMPVLEREVDLVIPNPVAIAPSHPHIFPSTVTPPPTPPLTESPDIDEIKRELKTINQSVFESRLSPVENGIKLRINRLSDEGGKAKERKIETVKQESKQESVQNNLAIDTKHITGSFRENQTLSPGHSASTAFTEKAFTHVQSRVPETVLPVTAPLTDNILKQESMVDRRKSEGISVSIPLMPGYTSATQHQKVITSPVKTNVKQENLPNGGIPMVQTPYG